MEKKEKKSEALSIPYLMLGFIIDTLAVLLLLNLLVVVPANLILGLSLGAVHPQNNPILTFLVLGAIVLVKPWLMDMGGEFQYSFAVSAVTAMWKHFSGKG